MKKQFFFLAIMLIAFGTSYGQSVNDQGEVEHNGTWYAATILKVNSADGKFYIKYNDWDETWNEWVGKEQLRGFKEATKAPLTKYKVGDRVESEYGMIWEPAKVTEVGENKYHIIFDKFGDKWVTEKQLRKL